MILNLHNSLAHNDGTVLANPVRHHRSGKNIATVHQFATSILVQTVFLLIMPMQGKLFHCFISIYGWLYLITLPKTAAQLLAFLLCIQVLPCSNAQSKNYQPQLKFFLFQLIIPANAGRIF
jgi:hypothetical protein